MLERVRGSHGDRRHAVGIADVLEAKITMRRTMSAGPAALEHRREVETAASGSEPRID